MEDGADFAGQRAAALRRLYPGRPATVITSPPPSPPPSPPRRRRWGVAATVTVVALGAAGSAAALRLIKPDRPAPMSDHVAEGFPVVAPPSFDTPAVPISAYSACSSRTAVTFAVTFGEPYAYRHVFIDADADASTGYQVDEFGGKLGADYMIENGALHRSTGSAWSWEQVGGVRPLIYRSGNSYRWQVEPAYGGTRVVFHGWGEHPETYTPVVPVSGSGPGCRATSPRRTR